MGANKRPHTFTVVKIHDQVDDCIQCLKHPILRHVNIAARFYRKQYR